MIGQPLRMSACLALMLATPVLAASESLVTRWHAPADIESYGSWQALTYNARIDAPTRLRTGAAGRLDIQLVDKALLVLGGDSELLIHSTEAPEGLARRGLARVQLVRGRMRATAGPLDLWPPTDLRMNVGELRLRVFGADIWVATGDARDEVCLLHGAVEIQTPQGGERLDGRGDCLVWDGSAVQLLAASQAGPMATRLAQLEFPRPEEAAFTVTITPRSGTAAAPVATPAVAVASASPPADPPPTAIDGSASTRWSLVLASVPTREAAEQEVVRLRRRGLDTRIDAATDARGVTAYRLTYGNFYTREAAEQVLREQRRQRGFEKAWLLQQPGG